MVEAHFKTDFGNDWRRFSRVLRETAPEVVNVFRGTEFEGNLDKWYHLAVPQEGESPINCVLRNVRNTSSTTSSYHAIKLATEITNARLNWYTGKVPFLNRVMRLNGLSTELYIGQETTGSYVSSDKIIMGKGFGNDDLRTTISRLAEPMDLDIDVGFTNPSDLKYGRNWVYQSNVFDELLIPAAENAHQIIEDNRGW